VDAPEPLRVILGALGAIAKEVDVVLPLHPRTRKRVEEFGLASLLEPLVVTEPIGYTLMLALQFGAAAVVTDSGGIQEESTVLGVPCLTLRESTERPITTTEGTNRLAIWPLTEEGLLGSLQQALKESHAGVGARAPKGWDGHAGERVVRTLMASAVPGLGTQAFSKRRD
jgi:UDP-N-acetylglucosamine 2-epimerase (non-hydrolysing)